MAKYHVLASKEIKPCNETNCRAKHGSFATKKEATDFVRTLKAEKTKKVKPAPKKEAVVNPEVDESEVIEEIFDTFDEPVIFEEDIIKAEAEEKARNYLDDDEEFTRLRDTVLDEQPASGLFKQFEGPTVTFRIMNFYDDHGKPLSKYALRRNAPILQINASNSEAPIEMLLTENFVRALSKQTNDVYRAYYGLNPKVGSLSKKEEIKNWADANAGRLIFFGILFLAIIIAGLTL